MNKWYHSDVCHYSYYIHIIAVFLLELVDIFICQLLIN